MESYGSLGAQKAEVHHRGELKFSSGAPPNFAAAKFSQPLSLWRLHIFSTKKQVQMFILWSEMAKRIKCWQLLGQQIQSTTYSSMLWYIRQG